MGTHRTEDVAAIHAVLLRYASAVDESRWELLDTVFTPDADIDFTTSGGPQERSLPTFRRWLQDSIGLVPVTRHHVTNIRVDVDGDRARSTAYLHNPLADATGKVFLTIGGTYEDQWQRGDDGWRIVARVFTTAWFDGDLPDGITIGGS